MHQNNHSPLYKQKQSLGNYGENIAERFLQSKGFEILARNTRLKKGEIDLIVKDGNTTVFVEVKTRSNTNFGDPLSSITPRKFYNFQKTAQIYRKKYKIFDYRFDLIGITIGANGVVRDFVYNKDISF